MTALSLSTRVLHADLDTPVSAFLKLRPWQPRPSSMRALKDQDSMPDIQFLVLAPNEATG